MKSKLKKKTIKILFRVSGGKANKNELGLGHIFRCTNLASEFNANEIIFLLEDYGGAKKILQEYGFKNIILLKRGIKTKEDIEKTIRIITRKKIDVLIIDKYLVKSYYVNNVRKHVKTVLISDLRNIDYNVDLLINGFIGYKNKITKNKFGTRCLLGPNYQILNKNFSKKIKNIKKQYKVLVTFGGFDEKNITKIVLSALKNITKPINVKVILGISTPKLEFKDFLKQKRKTVDLVPKTKNMFKDILKSEFGICSGGITTYEFASVGVPFVIICQNRHQTITARQWELRGEAINLGIVSTKTQKKVFDVLEKISSNKLKIKNKRIVDGLGSQRVRTEIFRMPSRKQTIIAKC